MKSPENQPAWQDPPESTPERKKEKAIKEVADYISGRATELSGEVNVDMARAVTKLKKGDPTEALEVLERYSSSYLNDWKNPGSFYDDKANLESKEYDYNEVKKLLEKLHEAFPKT